MRIKRVRRGSRGYCYYRRRDGALAPLPNLPETDPIFLAAYAEAAAADAPAPGLGAGARAHPRALARLVDLYLDSPAFAKLAAATRETRRRMLLRIVKPAAAAAAPVTGLRPEHVERDVAPSAPGVRVNRLKAWRAVLEHAVALKWIAENPARAVKLAKARHVPHRRWTPPATAAFRAAWALGTQQRAAFELAYHHAPRRADLAVLNRRDVVAGMISWRQSKTGDRTVERALHPEARAAVEALIAARPGLFTFLETAQGRPRSIKALGEWFRAACTRAGLEGLTLHGLRHTLASDAAEEGASESQIQRLLGHRTTAEARVYTTQADAARQAQKGAEAAERNRKAGNRGSRSGNREAK